MLSVAGATSSLTDEEVAGLGILSVASSAVRSVLVFKSTVDLRTLETGSVEADL